MPNHRSAINSHQMHRVEDQITSEIHEGNYRPVHNKPCIISALGALPNRLEAKSQKGSRNHFREDGMLTFVTHANY